jgi:hypothetical protein
VLEAQLTEANARAGRAEQAVADERVRADVLRDKLEALRDELRKGKEAAEARAAGLEVDLVTHRLAAEQARTETQAAQEATRRAEEQAEALRQADAARKGRGLVARLRVAWRGE